MMSTLPIEQIKYLDGIAQELASAGHGQQGAIVDRACKFLGLTRCTIYEKLSQIGWSSERKKRSDSGQSRVTLEETTWVSNLIRQSQRQNSKSLMSVEDAINIAFANGHLANKCSASTMLRKMDEFNVHPKQLNANPITRSMRSLHPNHVWQFDVSICVLYYLKNQEGLQVMEESEFYKNKPANLERVKNDRVLRYLVTDHYSGAFHLSYILSPGESVEAITQFLIEAFSKRSNNELMHGVPFILIWDAGSANMAAMTKRLLDKLNVDHRVHTPGKPYAKGQVESMHNVVEKKFESRLAFQVVNNIEELNAMATLWSIGFQSQFKHTRHGQTRYGLYQTIRPEQLRLAPDVDVMRSFVQTDRVERTVKANDLSITFVPSKAYNSMSYSLEHLGVHAGEKVFVSVNLYRCPAIDVERVDEYGELHNYIVEPVEKDDAGFNVNAPVYGASYAAIADTTPQRRKKEMDKTAWGTSDPLEIKKSRKGRVRQVAFNGAIDAMADIKQQTPPSFMQRKGQPLLVDMQNINEPPLSEIKAWKLLAESLSLKGAALQPYKEALKQAYPAGFTRKQVEQFINDLGGNDACAQTAAI
ncbi:hypothetical protein [Shewanella sp. Isolate7]|uniref:hypothetical protein n=1 Tax=Shewanella sp. Isolate7 TaxID=2908528 RepID=UPI001EFECD45|nr:hypothetical protein [Shewanella sp. Isolate7]MCG9722681.1 hypothetical protein [Shewanella sp. Isolate7]